MCATRALRESIYKKKYISQIKIVYRTDVGESRSSKVSHHASYQPSSSESGSESKRDNDKEGWSDSSPSDNHSLLYQSSSSSLDKRPGLNHGQHSEIIELEASDSDSIHKNEINANKTHRLPHRKIVDVGEPITFSDCSAVTVRSV